MGDSERIRDVVVIGGGQAGLAMSYLLSLQQRDHVVLEKSDRIGGSWRTRWDSFTLVTPNWQLQLPGYPYAGEDPDGFLARDEIVEYLEDYARTFDPPIRFGVEVTALERGEGETYVIRTDQGDIEARNVVVAVGTFQHPRVPAVADALPSGVAQTHSSGYENPGALPEGAVLVVGSGQSGCQIAYELSEAGRDVFLSTGRAGRLPRSYRGRDGMWWAHLLGIFDETVDDLDSPEERFAANPQVSGRGGGQDIDLHEFAADGITLLGHLDDVRDGVAVFADDLHEHLRMADQMAEMIRRAADDVVAATGMELPEEDVVERSAGYDQDRVTELDLAGAGISTVVWATGYRWDYGWIDIPILDDQGYPVQEQGVTSFPGLCFLGLSWLHSRKSGLFLGVGEDAMHVAEHLAARTPATLGAG